VTRASIGSTNPLRARTGSPSPSVRWTTISLTRALPTGPLSSATGEVAAASYVRIMNGTVVLSIVLAIADEVAAFKIGTRCSLWCAARKT
jgi:hypothetical protein